MSDIERVIINTRERALSTDQNQESQLNHRALLEFVRASYQGTGVPPISGVINGLQARPVSGTLDAVVDAGLAVKYDPANQGAQDSQWRWIRLPAAETVNLAGLVDPGSPRWVVIEIEAQDVVLQSALRDVFDPTLGTFTAQTLDKRRGSDPIVSARGGTPAAQPAFPAGIANKIPLAYIYVPAAAAVLDDQDYVYCRPILNQRAMAGTESIPVPPIAAHTPTSYRSASGGGVSVATTGLSARLHSFTGQLEELGVEAAIGKEVFADVSLVVDANQTYPVAAPNMRSSVSFFACLPPYPSGYDGDVARRELVRGDLPSIPVGGPLVQSVPTTHVRNCIIIASTRFLIAQSPAGNPFAAFFAVAQPATRDPAFGGSAAVAESDCLYLGSARLYGAGHANVGQMAEQVSMGSQVTWLEDQPFGSVAGVGISSGTFTTLGQDPFTLDVNNTVLNATIPSLVKASVTVSSTNVATTFGSFAVSGESPAGVTDLSAFSDGEKRTVPGLASSTQYGTVRGAVGTWTTSVNVGGDINLSAWLIGYRDSIIESR